MHLSHDVWQCQLGRTGQLISLINFSIKTVKSFIKDLYTVCQNSVRSQRIATYSEWTYGSAEHEKFFVSLELKVDEKRSQVKWETVHPFFCQKCRQNDAYVRWMLWFRENLKKLATIQQTLFLGGNNYCSRITRSWSVTIKWRCNYWNESVRWPLSSIIWHLHYVRH